MDFDLSMTDKINGGYYLKARRIQNSAIAHCAPVVREVWDWLIKECNFTEGQDRGIIVKRGQCLRSYNDILEGLHWKVGWRKMRYTYNQCEGAMKRLKKQGRIHTAKHIHGLLITICNYDRYQNSENYEADSPPTAKPTARRQPADTLLYNKGKNGNKGKKDNIALNDFQKILKTYLEATYPDIQDLDKFITAASAAFPGVDLLGESKRAFAWETANPERKKINHSRFLNNWWSKRQDSVRPGQRSFIPEPGTRQLLSSDTAGED